jgi:hypothetical protein
VRSWMQRLDLVSAAALKRGEIVCVTYRDAFSHRLILEQPLPTMPTEWQGLAFRHMTRRPVDLYAASSVLDAERLLAQLARQHGEWTLRRLQAEEAR